MEPQYFADGVLIYPVNEDEGSIAEAHGKNRNECLKHAEMIVSALNANALLVDAAKIALRAVNKELAPLHAKMATLSGPGLAIYEESQVYKGLIAQRDHIEAALKAAGAQ